MFKNSKCGGAKVHTCKYFIITGDEFDDINQIKEPAFTANLEKKSTNNF